MIQTPRRSVTRFFIPLIDVLILLFCIFLLMPLVKAPAKEGDADAVAPEEEVRRLREELAWLRQGQAELTEKAREAQEKIQKEVREVIQERLAARVLEIDPTTGRLYYFDPDRAEVRNEGEAHELIARDRKAQEGVRRELYYLIMYPRQLKSGYPERGQREQYERWFRDVPFGWDVPGRAPGAKGEKS